MFGPRCPPEQAGDWNDTLTTNSSTMTLCQRFQLSDPFLEKYPQNENFATYLRGTKRIDYFLVSSAILPAVQHTGYEPFHFRCLSDHRGYFLDLDTLLLFGNATAPLSPMAARDFSAKDPKAATDYVPAKFSHLEKNNFFNQLEQLINDPRPNPTTF